MVMPMHLSYDRINNYTFEEYEFFYNSLKVDYKKKVDLLLRENDKKLTILSQILLTKLLNDKYSLNYKNLEIKYNKYNKPFIDNIYFNISHSNEYAVVVTSNNKIGVDIEYIRKVDLNIINYFCTDLEKTYILTSEDKYKSLFEIFCLKESYFKMLGTGITNFKEIEFLIFDDIISCNKTNLNIMLNYSINNYVIAIIEEI